MAVTANQKKALQQLTDALRDAKFRRTLTQQDMAVQAVQSYGINEGDLPPGLLNRLSTLTEDELHTMANINAKIGEAGFIENGFLYF